ncbi:MAG TPA: glycosyltransferase family 1 protein, partial [Proteobacteria bacterium]|nr:glycosyltransferase family 1 protein [Pseudomonadota bacterium]
MRILAISHSAVLADYQERFSRVAQTGGIELTLLVPRRWRQFNRMIKLEKTADPDYRIISRQPFSWGIKGHGRKNVTHFYPGIKKLIREIQPDLIELWEEPFSAVTAHTIRAARRVCPGAKIIFFSAQNISRRYPPPFSFFERYTYRNADYAFVINSEAEQIIKERGWQNPSLVLPLGVNPAQFKRSDQALLRRQLGLTGFAVGFVGKLEKQKGVIDLLAAAAGLPESVSLLIIGDGPLKEQIQAEAKKRGLSPRVVMIDTVDHGDLPRYLNCMDLLVLPSITLPHLKEQFGRVLVEAMSCEVPVIGSDSGEIPNVIGDTGLVFPEGDHEALGRKITEIMDNPVRAKEFARRGHCRVEDEFAWSVIAHQQIKVY